MLIALWENDTRFTYRLLGPDQPETGPRSHCSRLLRRPSVARAVEEARPYRHLFPLGAPDRD